MSATISYDAMVMQLTGLGWSREKAEAAARKEHGLPAEIMTPEQLEADEARREKTIVHDADKQMRALGFTVWNLSQPRASKLSPGIPDRLYTSIALRIALFWEAKTTNGVQRPDQKLFMEHMDACGWTYLVGTDHALYDWLVERGIAMQMPSGLLELSPQYDDLARAC